MKKIPFHFLQPKTGFQRGRNDESSIALIITLAVMSLLLVLVLAFASISKVEIQTATANRDMVASRFLAQAALQRAIASLAQAYCDDPNAINAGLGSSNSWIYTNTTAIPNVLVSSVPANFQRFVTDIEGVNASGKITAGSDGNVDYVVLPGISTSSSFPPQWIAIRDTNNNIIGRVAFQISAGGLCINAIGNTNGNSKNSNIDFGSRNQGQSPGEINLPAALTALGWSYNDAVDDAEKILLYRYGSNQVPGVYQVDDNNNATQFAHDGIDNNGDGWIDEPGEGIDEPEEVLANSDETDHSSISAVGDDRIITDLKQLHNGTVTTNAAMNLRFQSNFSKVLETFVTQSPVRMKPNLINLNDTNYLNNQTTFYNDLTNRFAAINAFGGNVAQQVQVACNIVSYRTNASTPFTTNVFGRDFVGVGEYPLINEIVYEITATSSLVDKGGATNIVISLVNKINGETWYPYTNSFSKSMGVRLNCSIDNITPSGISPIGFQPLATNVANLNPSFSYTQTSLSGITNSTQFKDGDDYSFSPSTQSITGGIDQDILTYTNDITLSGFHFGGRLVTGVGNKKNFDIWNDVVFTNSVIFKCSDLTNGLNAAGDTNKITTAIAIALNDPRYKPLTSSELNNYVEYTGLVTAVPKYHSLGECNPTNTYIPNTFLPIYNPTAAGADDALVPGGIAPKTFYVSKSNYFSSAAELGRVHRGQPWKTIDFTGVSTNQGQRISDGPLLDEFTVWKPLGGTNYLHGRVNINAGKGDQQLAIWAALFAGMPLYDGTSFIDYNSSGILATDFAQTKALRDVVRIQSYPNLAPLVSTQLANMNQVNPALFSPQLSDEQREWFIEHMLNLVNTGGGGNFFTIYAWGQALKGGTDASSQNKKTVASETLIVAMVQAQVIPGSPDQINLNVVYFRYNPDLDFNNLTP